MKAVVIGSTGLVGEITVKKLLEKKEISQVVTLSRRKLKFEHIKLLQISAENLTLLMEEESTLNLLNGAELFYSALGSTIKQAGSKENFYKIDFSLVLQFANLAKKFGGKLSVVSAKGADSGSFIFYNKVKGEVEEEIQKLSLPSLHLFRPSLLKGKRIEIRTGEMIFLKITSLLSKFLPAKIMKNFETDVEILAEKMVSESFRPQEFKIFEAEEI